VGAFLDREKVPCSGVDHRQRFGAWKTTAPLPHFQPVIRMEHQQIRASHDAAQPALAASVIWTVVLQCMPHLFPMFRFPDRHEARAGFFFRSLFGELSSIILSEGSLAVRFSRAT
jgi:hypothetical protein